MLNTFKNKQTSLSIALALNLTLLFVCFRTPILGLWTQWQNEEYSHGPMLLVIALLIGLRRLQDNRPKAIPCWEGLLVIAAGVTLLIVSQLSAFEPPSHYGFLLALTGILYASFGSAVLKTIAPALIYLLFAIPLPRLIYVDLSTHMQLISSNFGVLILQLLDVPVFQDGNVIDLGTYQLQVAEACSGLRYLFPLTSFAFLIAYLYKDRFWKRALLLISAAPITIFLNALRIALIGITVDRWGIEMAQGVLHHFEGWVVFILCVLLLFVETACLRRFSNKGGSKTSIRYDLLFPIRGKPLFESQPQRINLKSNIIITVLFATTLLTGLFLEDRHEVIPQHPPFATFPLTIDTWHGNIETFDPGLLSTLGVSDYWMANYRRDDNEATINLYMAYYDSQRLGSSIHSPANCIPGHGWQIKEKSIVQIETPLRPIPATRMHIQEGNDHILIYYWFEERGRIINDQYGAKWYMLIDAVMLHRTDGALLRFSTTIASGEAPMHADERLRNFIASSYVNIRAFVPD